MNPAGDITPQQFADAFRRVLEWAEVESRLDQSPFKARLIEHFQADPATYPVTGESVATYDLPNLQLALDAYLGENGRDHELLGFGGHVGYAEMSLAGLVHDFGFGIAEGPVRRTVVSLERGHSVTCVTTGLFLITEEQQRLAVLVMQGERGFDAPGLRVEVIAAKLEAGESFLARLRALMHEHNVFRGKVLELRGGDQMMGQGMTGRA